MTKDHALRIVFMGTPDFAVPALKAILATSHHVVGVYSQPPRPKGRGQAVQKSPVQQVAEAAGIPVFTPKSLKKAEEQAIFAALRPDVAVVAAYGLLLPKAVLNAPRFGCINLHGSILPRWRGASPIQHAIWYQDAESGVTIMQMDEGMDTGAMIEILRTPLTESTTTAELHDTLAGLGAAALPALLDRLAATGARLPSTPQGPDGVTHARLLTREDGVLDWSKPAPALHAQVRALNPWPGCFMTGPKGRVKVLATALTHASAVPQAGDVVCGDGAVLRLVRLQPDNAKPMDFAAALNGGYVAVP